MLNWKQVNSLSAIYGDSFFVYDENKFRRNFVELSRSFNTYYSKTCLAYSYKTNYSPMICQLVDALGGYAEVVSEMEYGLAKRLGIEDKKIIYNGPCKSVESLKSALLGGAIVNIDSKVEFELIKTLCDQYADKALGISIRCNFNVTGDGSISRFGVDVESEEFREMLAQVKTFGNLKLRGLHCHFPQRSLETYERRVQKMLALCEQAFEGPAEFVNIGGGYYGNVPEQMRKRLNVQIPNYAEYGRLIGGLFESHFGKFGEAKPILLLEPGTALVADTFRFITKVINTKVVRGRNIATVTGSMFNISPYSRFQGLPVSLISSRDKGTDAKHRFDIAGYTCIEGDYLSKDVPLEIEVGDYLIYDNVGSYSIVMKPPFILPNCAILRYKSDNDSYDLMKQSEKNDYLFQNFVFG